MSLRRLAAAALVLAACPAGPGPAGPARPALLVGRAPDLNGDGYADLAIAAPGAQPEEIGRVYVYFGGAGGWPPRPSITLAGPDVVGARFGVALATGDVDGDGLADLVVGAPGERELAGRVHVYRGARQGFGGVATWRLEAPAEPVASTPGPPSAPPPPPAPSSPARFGSSLAATDVDHDGFADIVVGAPGAGSGRALVFRGGPRGPAAIPAVIYVGEAGVPAQLGAALAGAGDVDGDGFGDLLVGAPYGARWSGQAALFAGGEALSPVPAPPLAQPGASAQLGAAVAGPGDMDGDGLADVLVGGPGARRVWFFRGSRAGLVAEPAATITSPVPPAACHRTDDPAGCDGFGGVLAAAGDLDGDGTADAIVGAPLADRVTGRVFVLAGRTGGVPRLTRAINGPDGTFGRFGAALAGGGDADGDGRPEIVVAAPGARRVHVYAEDASRPVGSFTSPPGAPGEFGAAVVVTPSR